MMYDAIMIFVGEIAVVFYLLGILGLNWLATACYKIFSKIKQQIQVKQAEMQKLHDERIYHNSL